MDVTYYINNIEIEPPLNDAELSVQLNFDKDDVQSQAVSLNEFEFGIGDKTVGNDASTLINKHLTDGLSSGVGVFEGLPFRIELTDNGTTVELTNGYLDASKALFDCDRVVIPYLEKGNIDWLNEVADSVSFAYLYDPDLVRGVAPAARVVDSDFIPIPYVLSELPNNREAFLASISLFLISETIANQLQSLIEFIAGAFTGSISDIIKIILRIIYITGLLIAAYSLVRQIINLLIQPVKYHDGMRVNRLCERGAACFGLIFSSSILYSDRFKDMVIIPNKYNHDVNTNKDNILGFLNPSQPESRGYYNGTFGELLRGLKEMFNAKIIIDGNILRLEREDYNLSSPNYILPPVDQTDFKLNFEDLKSNYVVQFQTDLNDKNTLQRYEGTLTQVIQTPVAIVNMDMVLMKDLITRQTPFSRCNRKLELTLPETLLRSLASFVDLIANQIVDLYNEFIDIIDDVIDALNSILTLLGLSLQDGVDAIVDILATVGITTLFGQPIVIDLDNLPRLTWTNLGELIDDRIGMLTMENDFIDIQKIGIFDIKDNPRKTDVSITASKSNDDSINSEFLYNNFHFLRSFVPSDSKPNANQYRKFKKEGVPFCFDDFQLLRNNNKMQDDEGQDGKVISALWNIRELVAELDFNINKLYTSNIKESIITPDGK